MSGNQEIIGDGGSVGTPFVEASTHIIFDNGSIMKAVGRGFGKNADFVEWFGPSKANLAECNAVDAIAYMKTNGDVHYGGRTN